MKNWLDSLEQSAEPTMDECIAELGRHIDWLTKLKDVPQDPQWHGEGDVHIHTDMVLAELYQLLRSDASHITGWQRQALILGALLHDVGKLRRTKEMEIKGVMRIACPQHESVGRDYLAFKLMGLPLPFKVSWTVLGLVGEHHMPKLLVVKNQDKGRYLALSRRANLELLYWLEVADMRGRICPDLATQLQHLDEFRLFAEEYGVWQQAYFPTGLEILIAGESEQVQRYIIGRAIDDMQNANITMAEEALSRCYQHKAHHSHLVVLCGPSGSGKSTYVKQHYKDYECVSLDEIRDELNGNRASQKNPGQVLHQAKDQLKVLLRTKQNLVWDATSLRRDFRKIVCDFGRDYHGLVTLVVFLQSEKDLFAGNAKRTTAVTDDVLLSQLDRYQFPTVDEAHEYVVVGAKGEILWQSALLPGQQQKELHYES